MKITQQLKIWFERMLRERRYAKATKPAYPAPSWIASAISFNLIDGNNPLTPIAAGRVGWVENAAAASRYLLRYALEIQSASDSLDATRSHLALTNTFVNNDQNNTTARRAERLAFTEQSAIGALERQRRALTEEIEALCLLAGLLRTKLGARSADFLPADRDKQHSVLRGMTLLAYFVGTKRLDAVEYMLFCGANAEAKSLDGTTPIGLASRKAEAFSGAFGSSANQSACILALLEHNALAHYQSINPSKPRHRI